MIPPADADDLLAYLDDTLSVEERLAFEERLKSEPLLVRALLLLAREETILNRWARADRNADVVARAAGIPFPARRPMRRRTLLRYVLAAAAVLIVAGSVFLFGRWSLFRGLLPVGPTPPVVENTIPPDDRPPAPIVACLAEMQGDVKVTINGVRQPAVRGQELAAGSEVHTHGEDATAVVRYPDDTRLEVGAATSLRLEVGPATPAGVGKRVVLLEGTLGANVRHQPDGLPLILRTPHAEVTVRGTRFTSSSTVAATRVELQEGQIQVKSVEPDAAAEEVDVRPGSYAVVSPQTRHIALDRLPPRRTDSFALLQGSGGPVLAVAFGPDGLLSCLNADGFASVWDTTNNTELRRLERPPVHFTALALSPDGKTLALGGQDRQAKIGWVTLWETATGRELGAWRGPRDVLALAFSADGRTLAIGGNPARKAGEVALSTLTDGVVTAWPIQVEPVHALAFSPEGRTLAVGGRDGVVRLYDTTSHESRTVLHGSTGPVQALTYSADGAWLAGGGKDGAVRVWEIRTEREQALLFNPKGGVTSVAFTPDAGLLLTAGRPGFATLWDRVGGREVTSFQGHKAGVAAVAVSPDGHLLATASWDRSVKLWRLLPPPRWWQPCGR